ncbi:hypothetical protein JX266_012168 [Neoarthrinium moseri]|nr:hypothetical protein JX266_012168 [Neoarthrinium moseri]
MDYTKATTARNMATSTHARITPTCTDATEHNLKGNNHLNTIDASLLAAPWAFQSPDVNKKESKFEAAGDPNKSNIQEECGPDQNNDIDAEEKDDIREMYDIARKTKYVYNYDNYDVNSDPYWDDPEESDMAYARATFGPFFDVQSGRNALHRARKERPLYKAECQRARARAAENIRNGLTSGGRPKKPLALQMCEDAEILVARLRQERIARWGEQPTETSDRLRYLRALKRRLTSTKSQSTTKALKSTVKTPKRRYQEISTDNSDEAIHNVLKKGKTTGDAHEDCALKSNDKPRGYGAASRVTPARRVHCEEKKDRD